MAEELLKKLLNTATKHYAQLLLKMLAEDYLTQVSLI
jgi:hypothetical protein